jgi:hypothetical protein
MISILLRGLRLVTVLLTKNLIGKQTLYYQTRSSENAFVFGRL